MNYSMIRYVLGFILICTGALMILPFIVCLIYGESVVPFIVTIAISFAVGGVMIMNKPKSSYLRQKEGFAITALSWVVLSVVGAVPFVISGSIPNPVDAVFETASGFTTTGASIVPAVEDLTHGILFWRSFTHWVGGMGVLVFLLCLLPMTGGSQMNLMKAESPGPQVEKLVPKVQQTAGILYSIYFGLTAIEAVFLLIAGMPLFDALTTAFGTAGTGGFGIKNDSIGGYSPAIQWIVAIFMIMFGINFNFYFFILLRKVKKAIAMTEVKTYLAIIFIASLVITINTRDMFTNLPDTVRSAVFQVGSIITTTGFATVDFDLWPHLSRTILVVLMFVGACAGSTGGGIKVSRFIIMFKAVGNELKTYIHPSSINHIWIDGKVIPSSVVRNLCAYLIAYAAIFALSVLIISLDNFDLTTNFTAVAATFNNIGPGLNLVGPTQNFSIYSNLSKIVLTFDMLAGRLEIFPMLLLFYPETWKKF